MYTLKPDMYKKNIYEINYKKLRKMGKKYLFFDLDNTIISYDENNISKDLINLFLHLKGMGFKCNIFSNSNMNRLKIFKEKLDVDVFPNSMKPLKKNYKKIIKLYEKDKCAFIGDQIMTDVIGAKRNKLFVIFVDKIDDKEPIYTKFWRFFERFILKKYEKEKVLVKGCYYE